jgi:hypothetical protein
MFSWDKKWAKKRSENLIVEYVREVEGRTLESTLEELRSLFRKGLTRDGLLRIIKKIETSPLYFPLQNETCRERLNRLKEGLQKK